MGAVLLPLALALAWTGGVDIVARGSGGLAIEPRSLVLQPADVGPGMRRVLSRRVAPARLSGQGGAPQGVVAGWEVAYVADSPIVGAVQVRSTVGVYGVAADARAAVAAGSRAARAPKGWRLTRLRASRVGDLTRMIALHGPGPWGGVTFYVVSWASGNVQAGVTLGGISGTIRASQAWTLALRQQARIGPVTASDEE